MDAVGTTRYSYGSAGQLLSEDGPWDSDTVSYSYNNRLRSGASVAQPSASAWAVSYGYDAAKRLTSVTSSAGAFGYQYGVGQGVSLGSLVRKLTLPGGSTITNAYDGNARLLFTKLFTSGGTLLDGYTYGYNVGNQRTGVTRTDGSTVAYAYDAIGQLQIADSSVSGEDRGYAHDPAWNLRHRTNNGVNQNFHVNGKNELTNYTYGGFCSYDANGFPDCSDPCGDAKKKGLDKGNPTGTVCCGGMKFACVWDSDGDTNPRDSTAKKIIKSCLEARENEHVKDPAVTCSFDCLSMASSNREAECRALGAELGCLRSAIRACAGNPQCINQVKDATGTTTMGINDNCGK